MPKVRTLEVIFDLKIQAYEVPAFRGAVIELVGRDHVAFHNHIGDNDFHFRYPTLQYKRNHEHASIFCIEDGIEELYALFSKKGQSIRLGDKQFKLNLKNISISNPFLQVWDKTFKYHISNWLPLNQKNFTVYQEKEGIVERMMMLESILKGNMLSMAKAIGWTIEKEIEVKITEIRREKSITYKGIRLLSMDIDLNSNVFLPNQIGLGKGASTGFGVVRHKKEINTNE